MNWPIVMYMGLVVAAPYLMWKLVASVAGLEEEDQQGGWEAAQSGNEVKEMGDICNACCKGHPDMMSASEGEGGVMEKRM